MAEEKKKETLEVETPVTSEKEGVVEEKTFTQAELNDILKQRLARQEKDLEVRIKEAQKEAERLAKLSAEEKEKELVARSTKELEGKMKEVSIRENRLDAIELFTESKVPASLVDYVINEDKEKTLENAKTFAGLFNDSVAKAVAEQLKGTPPKDISANSKEQSAKAVVTTF